VDPTSANDDLRRTFEFDIRLPMFDARNEHPCRLSPDFLAQDPHGRNRCW
jgi:hypothetical protein